MRCKFPYSQTPLFNLTQSELSDTYSDFSSAFLIKDFNFMPVIGYEWHTGLDLGSQMQKSIKGDLNVLQARLS